MVSPNELVASGRLGGSYRLYRVHSFKARPKLFVLRGALDALLILDAAAYRARLKPVDSGAAEGSRGD